MWPPPSLAGRPQPAHIQSPAVHASPRAPSSASPESELLESLRLHPAPLGLQAPVTPRRAERRARCPQSPDEGLTLARRRARNATRGVADDGVPLHTGRVWRRFAKETQQFIVLAQGREGPDSQLHLGTGGLAPDPLRRPALGHQGTPGTRGRAPCPRAGVRQYKAGSPWRPQEPQVRGSPTSAQYLPSSPTTHLPLGPAAHVLWLRPSDGYAGLVTTPQPVAVLLGPWAVGPPAASAGAGGGLSLAPASHTPGLQGRAEAPGSGHSPSLGDAPAAVGVLGAVALGAGGVAPALLHGQPQHLGRGRRVEGCSHRPRASRRCHLPLGPRSFLGPRGLVPPLSLSLRA